MNNFIKNSYPWLTACAVSALAGALFVLWIKSSKSQPILPSPVVDKPAPVQPQFDSAKLDNVNVPLKRLGGSSGATQTAQAEPQPPPPETVYQSPFPTKPCESFSLHLKSSPTSLSSVLDSVTLDYFYPSGMNNWQYWGARQNKSATTPNQYISVLSYGVSSKYLTYGSRLILEGYGNLQLDYLTIQGGYRVEGNSHPAWFVGVRKEWKIF